MFEALSGGGLQGSGLKRMDHRRLDRRELLRAGQNPNCGRPECGEALKRCADSHRVDERRFHGPVNVAIIERRVWERYAGKVAEEAS